MLPPKSHSKWVDLIKGDVQVNFSVFAGNMLINRLSRSVKKDSSKNNVQKCVEEAYNFFSRFSTIYKDELNTVFR